MAKPKKAILIEKYSDSNAIHLWVDNASNHIPDILSIEGVVWTSLFSGTDKIKITVDPRYDIDEIGQELEELLTAEVPDVFKE